MQSIELQKLYMRSSLTIYSRRTNKFESTCPCSNYGI